MMNKSIDKDDIIDEETNLEMGSWYMRYLLNRCGDSFPGAISAYNAGWGKMSAWRRRFDPESNPMLAIELIGVTETRNYVKKVLDSAAKYQWIYNENSENQ
jgi:soluble lytic murein transglycosylase